MIEEQIKPSELRIGNYLQNNKGEVRVVSELNCNKDEFNIQAWGLGSDRMYGSNEDNLQPIPLTEDWLVKFKGEKTNRHWFNYSYKDIEISHNIMNGVVNLFQPINSKEPITIRDIYKVHTFQNLYFALTKEELKITE